MFKVKVGNNSGFTFMELLFVMLVIGIMAAVFLPSFVKSQVDSQIADRVIGDIKLRSEAIRWYYLDKKTIPAAWNDLKNENYLPSTLPDSGPLGNYIMENTTNVSWINQIRISNVADGVIRKTILNSISTAQLSGNDIIIGIVKPGQEASLQAINDRLDNIENKINSLKIIKSAGIYAAENAVLKPVCDSGLIPRIYATPVGFKAGTSGYSIVGAIAYAVDSGASWTLKGIVKGSDGNLYQDSGSMYILAYTFCE